MQLKTQRPVQFEITAPTRKAVKARIKKASLKADVTCFRARIQSSPHLGTRQYARMRGRWVVEIGLDPAAYGTHSIRRTKAALIYRRTKNLRAVQLLLEAREYRAIPWHRSRRRTGNRRADRRLI